MERTLRYRWLIFVILAAAYFLVYFHRVAPGGGLGLDITAELGGDLKLFAAVYFLVYLAMQIPAGLMADRIGLRKITFGFLLLSAAGTFIVSYADSFALAVIGKAMVACGMALVYIPLTKILAVWFRKRDFATLNGSVIAVGNIGAIAAGIPFSMLLAAMGWRTSVLIIGIITLILAMLCFAFVRDRPGEVGGREIHEIYPDEVREAREKVPLKEGVLTAVLSGRAFWMPAAGYFLVYGSIMLFQGLWCVTYFLPHYGRDASVMLMTMIGVGKILSAALAGTLARRIGSKRTVMIFGNIGYLAIWGVIWLFAVDGDMYWLWVCVNFMFGFFSGLMVLAFAQAKEWFPVSISGTVISLVNTMIFAGAFVSQYILSELVGRDFGVLWASMFIWVAAACVLSCLSVDNRTGEVKAIYRTRTCGK